MTTNFYQESAKIYQFPARGRKAVDGRTEEIQSRGRSGAARFAPSFGSGWYHEAAIQESKRIRER